MKNILYTIILSFLFSSHVYSEVYYCSEEKVTGFTNALSREAETFKGNRFSIQIKYDQAKSRYIFYSDFINAPCITLKPEETGGDYEFISCTNTALGKTFSLNTSNMIFTLTATLLSSVGDSIYLAIGKCEKFSEQALYG